MYEQKILIIDNQNANEMLEILTSHNFLCEVVNLGTAISKQKSIDDDLAFKINDYKHFDNDNNCWWKNYSGKKKKKFG
jgi:hypothetical protein